jgi:hypothetical protein
LDFQEIKEEPSNTQNPVIDFLVSGHLAQSESAKALIFKGLEADKNMPLAGADLRYLRMPMAAL